MRNRRILNHQRFKRNSNFSNLCTDAECATLVPSAAITSFKSNVTNANAGISWCKEHCVASLELWCKSHAKNATWPNKFNCCWGSCMHPITNMIFPTFRGHVVGACKDRQLFECQLSLYTMWEHLVLQNRGQIQIWRNKRFVVCSDVCSFVSFYSRFVHVYVCVRLCVWLLAL